MCCAPNFFSEYAKVKEGKNGLSKIEEECDIVSKLFCPNFNLIRGTLTGNKWTCTWILSIFLHVCFIHVVGFPIWAKLLLGHHSLNKPCAVYGTEAGVGG